MKHNSNAAAFLAFTAAELGAAPEHISPGETRRFSTNGKPTDTAGACLMFPDGRGGICTDFRKGITHTWSAVALHEMTTLERNEYRRQVEAAKVERDRMQKRAWASHAKYIQRCLDNSLPLKATDPAVQYLARRGLTGPMPACLRLHPSLRYFSEGFKASFPAMIAPLISPDGKTVALHRTYLTVDGYKAPVETPKKLSVAVGPLVGACIPLYEPHDGVLGIAEGIETSLAAHELFGVPTVAAYCANNLSKFNWPLGLRRLVIFADNDEAGLRAAAELEKRAQRADLQVEVFKPSDPGDDWCDVLQRKAKVGTEVTQ